MILDALYTFCFKNQLKKWRALGISFLFAIAVSTVFFRMPAGFHVFALGILPIALTGWYVLVTELARPNSQPQPPVVA